MVISGNKRVRRDIETVKSKEDMDRFKPPLHNFDFPFLKWGTQKHLRCINVEDYFNVNISPSSFRSNQSPETSDGGGGRREKSSGCNNRFLPSSEKLKERIGVVAGDGGEMEATREKLMFDFKKEVDQMKVDILRVKRPACPVTTENNPPPERPWNLRNRGDAFKPPSDGVKVNGNDEFSKPNWISRDQNKSREKRKKFSVSLSRDELEDDFMAMTGRRLPRRPMKRPRALQKQLDTLFPGLCLSEITADMYKVPEEADTRKR
ncbi:uncharacterized protein [Rutidosis leptorrhynchoides]|uniref:uncharacterized protein n=1 Tax=Rutidosis leptorrhynchoides TaxID=125765 RepID=UPI003A99B598